MIKALILDPWERPSLAACRALGRADGYVLDVAGYDRRRLAGPAAVSRFVRRFHRIPDPAGPRAAFDDALRGLVAREGYDVLVATSDLTLARLSTLELPLPSFPDTGPAFCRLVDKVALEGLSRSAGVAYPTTRMIGPEDDVESIAAANPLPLIIKSARSASADEGGAAAAKGAQVCRTIADVLAAVAELRAAGLVPILQERVPFVDKLNAAVIRNEGRSEFRYAHRVLREAPAAGGMGVSLVTISPDSGAGAEAVEQLERICDAAGYRGLAQAEFYRSGQDGRLYLLDVNPRLWGSTWFAERLGQRLTERGVRFALGLAPIDQHPYRVGRRFHAGGVLRWLADQEGTARGLLELVRTTRPWDVVEIDPRDMKPLATRVLQAANKRSV